MDLQKMPNESRQSHLRQLSITHEERLTWFTVSQVLVQGTWLCCFWHVLCVEGSMGTGQSLLPHDGQESQEAER